VGFWFLQLDSRRTKPIGDRPRNSHIDTLSLLDAVELIIALKPCAGAAIKTVSPRVVDNYSILVNGRRAPGLPIVRVPGRAGVIGGVLVDEREDTGKASVTNGLTWQARLEALKAACTLARD